MRVLDASTEKSSFMREVSINLVVRKCLLLNFYSSKSLVSWHVLVVGTRDLVMLLRNGILLELITLMFNMSYCLSYLYVIMGRPIFLY